MYFLINNNILCLRFTELTVSSCVCALTTLLEVPKLRPFCQAASSVGMTRFTQEGLTNNRGTLRSQKPEQLYSVHRMLYLHDVSVAIREVNRR